MSGRNNNNASSGEGWDSDPTDGREKNDWKTSYPDKAAKDAIHQEAAYLTILFIACILGVFRIVYATDCDGTANTTCPLFLAAVGAFVAGTLGGCCFGIKWLYHIVAKKLWHEDRRLWRFLSPLTSGALSLFMMFLVSGGFLQLFDKSFCDRPISIMGFSFLVGYFSDNALAKMTEVAETLFGGKKKPNEKKKGQDEGRQDYQI